MLMTGSVFLRVYRESSIQHRESRIQSRVSGIESLSIPSKRARNINKIMQNEPKYKNAKMNVIALLIRGYENLRHFTRNENEPKRTQNEPKQTQF